MDRFFLLTVFTWTINICIVSLFSSPAIAVWSFRGYELLRIGNIIRAVMAYLLRQLGTGGKCFISKVFDHREPRGRRPPTWGQICGSWSSLISH